MIATVTCPIFFFHLSMQISLDKRKDQEAESFPLELEEEQEG